MSPMSTSGGPRQPYDDGRWAPFPVQDWSAMPGPREAYDPYTAVDPGWSAPESGEPVTPRPGSGGPRWLPLLVVIVVTVLVAGVLATAERLGSARDDRDPAAASRFLPGDGAVRYERRDTLVGGSSTSSAHVQESARGAGALLIGGLDFTLGVAVLGVVGSERLDRMSFWRTTDTEIDNLG